MLIFGTCVGDEARYLSTALPTIEAVAAADDFVWSRSGRDGIAAAYDDMIAAAQELPGCDGLVLLHEDVEIVDGNFRPKLLRALAEPAIGVVGVVGACEPRGLGWWDESRRQAGLVYETRRVMDFGPRHSDVDVVDGLFMALTPAAFSRLSFDGVTFPAFHGYDLDFCLQVREAGLRVVVRELDLFHRTKTGYGDVAAYERAASALATKWPRRVRPPRVPPPLSAFSARVRRRISRARQMTPAQMRARGRLALTTRGAGQHQPTEPTESADGEPDHGPSWPEDVGMPRCPVCVSELPAPATLPEQRLILSCATCGTGVTWPRPDSDLESDDLFTGRYGGSRLARRDVWVREAQRRLHWLQLLVPEGTLLEVGPATGEFLEVTTGAGYSVSGVEASSWAAEHSRSLGLDVTTGFLADWRAEHSGIRVDAIVMWHVLEHVADPATLLRELHEVLGAAGQIVVEVPNFASSLAAADGPKWEFALLDDHYFHYTPHGIAQLFRTAGYDVVAVLECSTRVYESLGKWHERRNRALLERIPWPSLDLLRVTARVGAKPQR